MVEPGPLGMLFDEEWTIHENSRETDDKESSADRAALESCLMMMPFGFRTIA